MSYIADLERKAQALKGLIMTITRVSFILAYAKNALLNSSSLSLGIPSIFVALFRIAQAAFWTNNFSSCLHSSVISFAITDAFSQLAGSNENANLQNALNPLREIVERKVWSTDERKELFKLCFEILTAFRDSDGKLIYSGLIDELKCSFADETAEIEIPQVLKAAA